MGRGGSRAGGGVDRSTAGAGVVGVTPTVAGVMWKPAPGSGYVTVKANVAKLDASLAKDVGFYVGPGGMGKGAKPGAYANVGAFVAKAKREGLKVEQPKVGLSGGEAHIVDGRHRFAWFRDHGLTIMPVSVHRSEAKAFRERFGSGR